MLETKDECDCQTCSMAALMKQIFFYEWVDAAPSAKKTMTRLLLIYLESDLIENHDKKMREEIAGDVFVVIDLLELLMEYELKHAELQTNKN